MSMDLEAASTITNMLALVCVSKVMLVKPLVHCLSRKEVFSVCVFRNEMNLLLFYFY